MATERLGAKDFTEEWYNQDYESMDMVPLIEITDAFLYLATGFRKWASLPLLWPVLSSRI